MSPFSPLCNYSVTQFAWQRRGNLNLSPRDEALAFKIKLAGAAAFFQICDNKRDKVKLKTLGRAGVINLYLLEGAYRMHVASWENMNLDRLLRSLVLCQYLLISGSIFDGEHVIIDGAPYTLFVTRNGDAAISEVINRTSRALILAEEYDQTCGNIEVPALIVYDSDLSANSLRYYEPGIIPTCANQL